MQVMLHHTEEIAPNIKTFWFKPEKMVDYTAGQFIEMYLPHINADERGEKHWFTLSSSPTEDLISITTHYDVLKSSTFKQVLFGLKPGNIVTISEPMGDFVLPKDTSIPLVFVAGGIGITPMRSMLKWLADTKESRSIQVIYAAEKLDMIVFRKLIESYGASLNIVLSDPGNDWTGKRGRLDANLILEITGPYTNQLFYVSGPEPMTEKLEVELLASGIPSEKLVLDFFPGYLLT